MKSLFAIAAFGLLAVSCKKETQSPESTGLSTATAALNAQEKAFQATKDFAEKLGKFLGMVKSVDLDLSAQNATLQITEDLCDAPGGTTKCMIIRSVPKPRHTAETLDALISEVERQETDAGAAELRGIATQAFAPGSAGTVESAVGAEGAAKGEVYFVLQPDEAAKETGHVRIMIVWHKHFAKLDLESAIPAKVATQFMDLIGKGSESASMPLFGPIVSPKDAALPDTITWFAQETRPEGQAKPGANAGTAAAPRVAPAAVVAKAPQFSLQGCTDLGTCTATNLKPAFTCLTALSKAAGSAAAVGNESDAKAAYRALAPKFHPDVNKVDPNAGEKFKLLNAAYSCVKESKK